MRFLFVRHAQPEWFADGAAQDDPGLTHVGHTQARLVAARLRTEHGDGAAVPTIDHFLVSPLERAQQTAAPIIEALGLTPLVCDWLREIESPPWHGAPLDHVRDVFEHHRNKPLDEHWDGLDGGESVRDFHERVCTGIQGFLDDHDRPRVHEQPALWPRRGAGPAETQPAAAGTEPVPTVLVTAHAGTNATLLGYLLGLEPVPWEWERFVTFHASISELAPIEVSGREAYSLRALSDVDHLPPGLRTA